jgi:hypothetical protein
LIPFQCFTTTLRARDLTQALLDNLTQVLLDQDLGAKHDGFAAVGRLVCRTGTSKQVSSPK